MWLDILLNLRKGRERVSVIRQPGATRPELGIAHPQDDDRRATLPERWGWPSHLGRREPLATIDEPLLTRSQTILSHRLPEHVREAINGDVTDALPASRSEAGRVSVKLKLGP